MNNLKLRKEKLKEGLIEPAKWVFPRTLTKELLSSRLYENLQRSLSNPDNFFLINRSHLKKNNKSYNREIFDTLTDCIIIEKDKLPKRFIELFNLDLNSKDIERDVKEIFKRARFLSHTESHRIIMIDDKIIVFRNEEILTHTDPDEILTQWAKRRSEIFSTFNTFNNIYDAVRSQYHIVNSIEKSQNDYKLIQHDLINLITDVKYFFKENTKDNSIQRKLDDIIKNIDNFKNSSILAAKLHNLRLITFENRSIDSKRLEWAKNKFIKRFDNLTTSIGIITKHLNLIETILKEHEYILEHLLSQLKFSNKEFAISNYKRAYNDLHWKHWDIAPFKTFNKWITTYEKDDVILSKFITKIDTFFNMYKVEHKERLENNKLEIKKEVLEIKENLSSPELEELIKTS